jgi:O-antigen/teichoic acid export membrane protein
MVVLTAIALPVVVCGVILAPGITNLVYGPKYHQSIVLLQILLPAFIPICLGYLLTSQLILHGRLRAYIAITGIAAILNIAANLAGLSQYGPPFAAWATFGTEVAVMLATGTVVRRGLQIGFPLLRSARCVAAVVPTACVVWLVRDEPLIVGLLVAAVLYPVSLLGSRAISVSDLRAFINERDLTKA